MTVRFADREREQRRQKCQENNDDIKQLAEKRASLEWEIESLEAQKATAEQQAPG